MNVASLEFLPVEETIKAKINSSRATKTWLDAENIGALVDKPLQTRHDKTCLIGIQLSDLSYFLSK